MTNIAWREPSVTPWNEKQSEGRLVVKWQVINLFKLVWLTKFFYRLERLPKFLLILFLEEDCSPPGLIYKSQVDLNKENSSIF
jgi:hypothetical protein